MNTADWALVISLGSFSVAAAAFVWNVWSKFIYPKPQIDVSFSVMQTFGGAGSGTDMFVLSATNFGPAVATIKIAVGRTGRSGWLRRRGVGVLSPLHNFPIQTYHTLGPFSGGLPKKVDVGEEFSVYFPYKNDADLITLDKIGFVDTFGRSHWCSRKQMQKAREKFVEDFGGLPVDVGSSQA